MAPVASGCFERLSCHQRALGFDSSQHSAVQYHCFFAACVQCTECRHEYSPCANDVLRLWTAGSQRRLSGHVTCCCMAVVVDSVSPDAHLYSAPIPRPGAACSGYLHEHLDGPIHVRDKRDSYAMPIHGADVPFAHVPTPARDRACVRQSADCHCLLRSGCGRGCGRRSSGNGTGSRSGGW